MEPIYSKVGHYFGASHLGRPFGKAKDSKAIIPGFMWNPNAYGDALDVSIHQLYWSNYPQPSMDSNWLGNKDQIMKNQTRCKEQDLD